MWHEQCILEHWYLEMKKKRLLKDKGEERHLVYA